MKHGVAGGQVLLIAVKRHERTLRAQLRLQQGEDEGLEGDEAGDDEEDDGLWGGRKRAYYGDAEDEACGCASALACSVFGPAAVGLALHVATLSAGIQRRLCGCFPHVMITICQVKDLHFGITCMQCE